MKQCYGAGIGLRQEHIQYIVDTYPELNWLEILIDNYMGAGGLPLQNLRKISEHFPITFHGVGLSICSVDELNWEYIKNLKVMIDEFNPVMVSDHLAWVSVHGRYLHDLLPIPYTYEALEHTVSRVSQIQSFLNRTLLLENPSTYLNFNCSEMSESEFLKELVEQTDCKLLLDVNNLYVSSQNHNFDPLTYLADLPNDSVEQIHLAGYEDMGDYLFDTHSQPVHPPVWELYRRVIKRFGTIPTLIEWDQNVPDFETLNGQANQAQSILDEFNEVQL